MKMETETSIDQLPKQISTNIQQIEKRIETLKKISNELHPEKIYDSFLKVDEFRRELFQMDLLSQNLMESYRVYSIIAAQALSAQLQEEETSSEEP